MSTIQFTVLKTAVQQAFTRIKDLPLFTSNATKDQLWDTYLETLGNLGHNEVYRERGEHDCQCCKSFIRKIGNIVAIKDGKLVSIWDEINTGTYYDDLAKAMSKLVVDSGIRGIFLSDEQKVGTDSNLELLDDGSTQTWEHFYLELPDALVLRNGEQRRRKVGTAGDYYGSLKLSMEQLTLEAAETVADLIKDNAIYRGAEHKGTVALTIKLLKDYAAASNKEHWLWLTSRDLGSRSTVRSTVIGTLIKDISGGMDIEAAVKAFESKVAPHNYKRSSAVVTKGMIQKAEQKVTELGMHESLARRHANITDITVNNVLFSDKTAQQQMDGVFGQLLAETTDNVDVSKAIDISIDDFIASVLPSVETLDAYLDNRIAASNSMSLVAPVNPDAPCMLKWDNNFSWTYNGDVTDSVKEKVKKAGGNVDGALRISLAWDNSDDYDLHVNCPTNGHIYYGNRGGKRSGRMLDVDMNNERMNSVDPVENITYSTESMIPKGKTIEVKVHNYSRRSSSSKGLTVEVEYKGQLYVFPLDRHLRDSETVTMVKFQVLTNGTLKIVEGNGSLSGSSKEVWGLSTQKLHRVSAMMLSPNYWDDNNTGNKHFFFMLDGFKNPDEVRGFYPEFLSQDLHENRKVFELLGSKMKAPVVDEQLSGLGFSSTLRNNLVVRTKGSNGQRLYNIKF